jgi:hypothetical protein
MCYKVLCVRKLHWGEFNEINNFYILKIREKSTGKNSVRDF